MSKSTTDAKVGNHYAALKYCFDLDTVPSVNTIYGKNDCKYVHVEGVDTFQIGKKNSTADVVKIADNSDRL